MGMVELNRELLRKLIETKFAGSVEELQLRWELLPTPPGVDRRMPPDRATIYRWKKDGTMPRNREDFLRLCAVLDVDPLCLLAPRNVKPDKAIEHLLSSFQLDHWRNPALSFLTSFFGRQIDWPPTAFARNRFGRPWIVRDFEHDPVQGANYYALIELSSAPQLFSTLPTVVHFAFRTPGWFRDRWLEYGIVQRFESSVQLFHINGHTDAYEADPSEPAFLETWFGPGPVVFRTASLHDYSLKLVGPNVDNRKAVRFPG